MCGGLKGSEGLAFTLNNDEESYSVSLGDCTDTDVLIPSTYKGLPVTYIADWAFCGSSTMMSITIPNSIVSIGDQAFYDCSLAVMKYYGSLEQWNNISKGLYWNSNTGNYTVYCTDGNITM